MDTQHDHTETQYRYMYTDRQTCKHGHKQAAEKITAIVIQWTSVIATHHWGTWVVQMKENRKSLPWITRRWSYEEDKAWFNNWLFTNELVIKLQV